MRSRLPDGRDFRGDAAATVRSAADPSSRESRPLRVSLLRRRLPGRPSRRGQQNRSRDVARHRAEHAEPGIDLREGSLRVRLPSAPGPTGTAADSKRLDQGKRPLVDRIDMDIRDRVATPDDWYSPFREATWDEALELTAQELLRIKGARGADSLACFSSAKCSNEENYLIMRMFRGALGTNNVDHCTRLCHSTSVAAMQRAINTAAASGSMRE